MLWALASTIAFIGNLATAACPYGSLPLGTILVADTYCYGSKAAVCGINYACTVVNSSFSDSDYEFSNLGGVGDLTSYTQDYLIISNTNSVNLKLMKLPAVVKSLVFRSVIRLDLTQIKSTLPDTLTTLSIYNSSVGIIPLDFKWPANLFTLVLRVAGLQNIPKNLPSSLSELYNLAIQGNYLKDLNYLPKNLTFINLAGNELTEVLTKDWRGVKFLSLSNNALTTFAFVELSASLEFFSCDNCSLSNITVNTATYAALNALPPWDRDTTADTYTGYTLNKRVTANPTACAAAGGTVKPLWASSSSYSISACVVGSDPIKTTTSPSPIPIATSKPPTSADNTNSNSSSNNTAMIVGIVVGVIGIMGIVGALIIVKRRNRAQEPLDDGQYYGVPYNPPPENFDHNGNSSFK